MPLAARDLGGTDGLEHPAAHTGSGDGRHHQRDVHHLALQARHHLFVGNRALIIVDEGLQQGVLANSPLARRLQERHLGVDMCFELLPDLLECRDPFIGAEPSHGFVRDQADIQIFRETRGQPVVGHQRRAALDGEGRLFAVEVLHGGKRTAHDQVLLRPCEGLTSLKSVEVRFDLPARWWLLHRVHGDSLLPVCRRSSVRRLEHGLYASLADEAAAGPVQPPHGTAGLLAVPAHRFAR